jgi:hypothetical protein
LEPKNSINFALKLTAIKINKIEKKIQKNQSIFLSCDDVQKAPTLDIVQP